MKVECRTSSVQGRRLNQSRLRACSAFRRSTFSLRRRIAFTIIEVMLAIGIFSMILLAIYSVWTGILKASKAART